MNFCLMESLDILHARYIATFHSKVAPFTILLQRLSIRMGSENPNSLQLSSIGQGKVCMAFFYLVEFILNESHAIRKRYLIVILIWECLLIAKHVALKPIIQNYTNHNDYDK